MTLFPWYRWQRNGESVARVSEWELQEIRKRWRTACCSVPSLPPPVPFGRRWFPVVTGRRRGLRASGGKRPARGKVGASQVKARFDDSRHLVASWRRGWRGVRCDGVITVTTRRLTGETAGCFERRSWYLAKGTYHFAELATLSNCRSRRSGTAGPCARYRESDVPGWRFAASRIGRLPRQFPRAVFALRKGRFSAFGPFGGWWG